MRDHDGTRQDLPYTGNNVVCLLNVCMRCMFLKQTGSIVLYLLFLWELEVST